MRLKNVLFSLSVSLLFTTAIMAALPETQKIHLIYRLLTPTEWATFQKEGTFKGTQWDQKDGFIHASFKEQSPTTLEKFFKDVRPVVRVEIDTRLLAPAILKVEANKPGGAVYPHIYGDLPLKAVTQYEILH